MHTDLNYFWHNLKTFSNRTVCIDTATSKSITYSELETDADTIANKIKLSNKGIVFLFTSNTYDCIAAYIGLLKSGNAVLLLDEKLNDEIRNDLIHTYTPEYVLTSSETALDHYSNSFKFGSLLFYERNQPSADKIFSELGVLLSTSG
ncbi:MAG: AMP-binding protein, partial [Ignavibacteriaceae bacterium]|nr:AMP-binding protein [Ignavibacteriaceae bacterium]